MAGYNGGLARLNRKLTRAIPERAKAAAKVAMEASANEIVAKMKSFAPVDTGDLQMSISWCWGNAPKGSRIIAQGAPDKNGLRITIYAGGPDTFYSWFQEFGTQFAAAQPFFYPVWRANKKRAQSRVSRAINKALKDGAK